MYWGREILSTVNRQNLLVHNSCSQQALFIELQILSKYLTRSILGENQGNPTMLNNYEQEVTSAEWFCCTHQLQEALGCGVVVAALVGEVLLAHLIHTPVDEGHELTDGLAHL